MYNPFVTHKDFFSSVAFRAVLWTLGVLVVALLIFRAGMVVGYRKAHYAFGWTAEYHRNFGGPERGFRDDAAYVGGHGAFGRVLRVDLPRVLIGGAGDEEKVVRINDRTVVRRFDRAVPAADLSPNDFVVVIGSPRGDGQVEASFIRVMPPPTPGKRLYFIGNSR